MFKKWMNQHEEEERIHEEKTYDIKNLTGRELEGLRFALTHFDSGSDFMNVNKSLDTREIMDKVREAKDESEEKWESVQARKLQKGDVIYAFNRNWEIFTDPTIRGEKIYFHMASLYKEEVNEVCMQFYPGVDEKISRKKVTGEECLEEEYLGKTVYLKPLELVEIRGMLKERLDRVETEGYLTFLDRLLTKLRDNE